ncbi:MAG: hypothetical protein FJ104_06985 [Deltaproteobacteria bacterium]|nr:hypothetical protein [Deltaproteobacteria bacterium]
MFGLALRSYQKKVRRLTESVSFPDVTLWQAVLEHVEKEQPVRRKAVLARFRADGEREVGAVLVDLVGTGLVYQTGTGADSVYRVTSQADLAYLTRENEAEKLLPLAWMAVHRSPGATTREVADALSADLDRVRAAVATLIVEGKLAREGDGDSARLEATSLAVPVGAALGWEVAVLDHFRAVANAIAAKVRGGTPRSTTADEVGGATLSFDVGDGHPFEPRVKRLLHDVREQVNALWNDVEHYNEGHGKPAAPRRIYFYFGQYTDGVEPEGAIAGNGGEER